MVACLRAGEAQCLARAQAGNHNIGPLMVHFDVVIFACRHKKY
jgi:hypothetical protein